MKKRILIVDDDEGITDAPSMLLTSEGYEVEIDATGERITSLQKENLPRLILLDVLLSGSDGRELCKSLKGQAHTKHIPVIMLSAATNIENSVRESQADDFLAKPFDMNVLLGKIQKYSAK